MPGDIPPLPYPPVSPGPNSMKDKMAKTDVRDRLKDCAAELSDLIRSGATKEQILNGANGKHGLNHVIEIFQMLPDGPSAEFKIKP